MNSIERVDATRHEYLLKPGQRVVGMVLGTVMIAAIIPLWYLAKTDVNGGMALLIAGMSVSVCGAYLLARAVRTRLTIGSGQIEVRSLLGERTFDQSAIEGWRTIAGRYGSYRVLCVKGLVNPITISEFATDDAFEAWFGELPDLDERDRKALLEQIEGDQELGATPEERRSALTTAVVWSVALTVITGAAAAGTLWGGAQVRSGCAVALWLAPVVVLLLLYRSPLLYAVFKAKKDPRAELLWPLMISAAGLSLSNQGANMVSWSPLLMWMALAAAAMILAFYGPIRGSVQFSRALIGLIVFSVFYSWGAVTSVDVLGDESAGTIYTIHVVQKYEHVSHGRGGQTTTYYLKTEPWGPYEESIQSIKVGPETYGATNEGDLICIRLRPGLLRGPWYEMEPCN